MKNTPQNGQSIDKKIARKLFLFALPIIILSPIIPVLIIFLPPKISHIFASVLAIYMAIILLTLTISLFFSPQIITKLSAIPLSFVMGLFTFIIIRFKLYLLVLNSFSLGQPFMLTSETIDETMNLLMLLIPIGVWISVLPLIIYSIRLALKSNKKKNLTNTIKGTAYVNSVIDTYTKINNNRVYHITLDVQPEIGQNYTAEKEFIIPNHIIHTITIGTTVNVLIDSNNPKEIYIETPYGIL